MTNLLKNMWYILLTLLLVAILNACKKPTLPVLTTFRVIDITDTSAVAGGNIIYDGDAEITYRGICYGTTHHPTINDERINDEEFIGKSFFIRISCLIPCTNYYLRAYATNSEGTSYGNEVVFRTYLADVDGNLYKTVEIGNQVWMAENLKTTRYNDGTEISLITNLTDWRNLVFIQSTVYIFPGFCWYNFDMAGYKEAYGALYNWSAVYCRQNTKLCPTGWHVPSRAEWTILEDNIGGSHYAGGHLKESGLEHWAYPNTGADNSVGFNALPGGFIGYYGFDSIHYVGYFWTSDYIYRVTDYSRVMYYNGNQVASHVSSTNNGLSVRCIKD